MNAWIRDLRYSFRRLLRRPVVALVAVATLACGLGATSAVLSIVHSVLLRPLQVADPDQLVYIVSTRSDRGGHYSVTYPSFAAWRQARSFAHLAAARGKTFALAGESSTERIQGTEVSSDYFATLRVEPLLGRFFSATERQVVMLSHGLWQRRFGADPAIVGTSIVLDGEAHTILGVMPPGTRSSFLGWRDVWAPLVVDETEALTTPLRGLSILGRLAAPATLETARREIDAIAERLETENSSLHHGWRAEMHPVRWWIVGSLETPLWLILGAAALVLLIACGTVANLLHALTAARYQEVAVRKTLGAGSGALLRQLLSEGMVLALAGGLGGIGLALLGIELLPNLIPDELPRFDEVKLSWPTTATTFTLAMLAGIGSCLPPALAVIKNAEAFQQAANERATDERAGRRVRHALIAGQTALATVAIIASGLLLQSLYFLRQVEPGFESENLLTLQLDLPTGAPNEKAARIALFLELLQRLDRLPGVEKAAVTGQRLPLTGGHGTFELYVEGQPRGPRPDVIVNAMAVSPSYFETMGLTLVQGRTFAATETWESAQSVVVNETLARRFWPGQDPLGRFVEWAGGERGWVIGVVGDVHQLALHLEPAAETYLAWGTARPSQAIALRTSVPPTTLLPAVRREIAALVPGAPVHSVTTGVQLLAQSLADRIFPARMLALFAAMAQGLGLLGLYGMVLYSVARRHREIAVRVALGAWPARIVRLVLSESLRPVVLGLVIGMAVAASSMRLLGHQLYDLAATDPFTFAAAASLILTLAGAICALPAKRAAATDPAAALRRT